AAVIEPELVWTWCFESMLVMRVLGGITSVFPSAWATDQETCRPAVEGIPLITVEPAVVLPVVLIGFAPASAANITCPFGMRAAGASSAPKLACLMVPNGLLKMP